MGGGELKNRGSFRVHAGIIDATCSFCRFFVLKKSQPVEKREGGGEGEKGKGNGLSFFVSRIFDGERVLLRIGS